MFHGGFSLDGLRTVVGLSEAETVDVLSSLVDKSLIQSRESDFGVAWFSMFDAIREFAVEQVQLNGEMSRFTQAFVDYFVDLSIRAVSGLKSEAQADWFRRMDANQPNLLRAVSISLAAQAGSILWKSGFIILEQLHIYWMLSNNFQLGVLAVQHGRTEIEKYVASLKKKDRLSLGVLGNMYALSGSIAWVHGDYEKARDWHASAYKIYEELKDESGMMNALNNWAVNLMALGSYDAALESFNKSLVLCRKLGDRWEEMRQLNNMAGCLITLDRVDEAWLQFELGLSLAREAGDQYFISTFLLNMGDLQIYLKKYHEAIRNLEQSLELSTPLDSFYIITWARVRMATAYFRLGRVETSISLLKDAYSSLEGFFDADLKRLTIETLISIYSHQNRNGHAAILLGFFQEYLKRSKFILNQFELDLVDSLKKNISRHFGGEQYEAQRTRGAAMSVKEALDFGMSELEAPIQTRKEEVDLFTVREREVLVLLAKGRSNEEISRELVVVLKTVEKHVANILRKLGVKNRTEAAAWAVENGIK
jgi:non-specific serine/threonine protein kinase